MAPSAGPLVGSLEKGKLISFSITDVNIEASEGIDDQIAVKRIVIMIKCYFKKVSTEEHWTSLLRTST